jgi:CRISPR/Cas system CSM-associated protein Csm3 (group 7 of RAMP superfamily)
MSARLRVAGWLELRTPLHVGGAAGTGLTIAADGLGRLYVPGTGLAGALRQWSQGLSDDDHALDTLWGFAEPGERDGSASRVVTRDALLTSGTGLAADGAPASPLLPGVLEVRAGVGIDDVTGTDAAAGILYDRVVVPAGAFLRLEFDVESAPGALDADAVFVGKLVTALAAGTIRLGAGKTRGLGKVQLNLASLRVCQDSFDDKAGLLALLTGAGSRERTVDDLLAAGSAERPRPRELPPPRELLTANVAWRPATPVLVRSAVDGYAVATVPLTSGTGPGQVSFVLPGSGIKGALRARAAWIERSVRGVDPVPAAGRDIVEAAAGFRAQRDELPAVCALFGTAPRSQDRRAGRGMPADEPAGAGAGAVAVDDCFASTPMPEDLWQEVYGVPPAGQHPADQDAAAGPRDSERAELGEELRDRLAGYGIERADHVAIDRWTGGAADGRLYSVLEPQAVAWDPITITVDLTRLRAAAESISRAGSRAGDDGRPARDLTADSALALFLLALRDLAEGWIPLGHGANRGLGWIEVERIRVVGPDWPDGLDLPDLLGSADADRLTEQWLRYAGGMSR